MKLSPTEVSRDTYNLLLLLRITPQQLKLAETIDECKKALCWLANHNDDETAELLAVSGEADPRIWNAIEGELTEALNKGMKYTHIIGPVVVTDECGKNAILEMRKKYPKNVSLYLTGTRKPYHWVRFTRKKNIDDHLFFRLHGECHHEPLASTRQGFTIWLENAEDPFREEKLAYWYNRERDFVWLKPIMDRVSDVGNIPTLTMEELKTTHARMKDAGINIDLETSEEIVKFIQ